MTAVQASAVETKSTQIVFEGNMIKLLPDKMEGLENVAFQYKKEDYICNPFPDHVQFEYENNENTELTTLSYLGWHYIGTNKFVYDPTKKWYYYFNYFYEQINDVDESSVKNGAFDIKKATPEDCLKLMKKTSAAEVLDRFRKAERFKWYIGNDWEYTDRGYYRFPMKMNTAEEAKAEKDESIITDSAFKAWDVMRKSLSELLKANTFVRRRQAKAEAELGRRCEELRLVYAAHCK